MLSVMAYLMRTNGDILKVKPNNRKVFTLKELQYYVGGYVEMVQLMSNRTLVVNEDGMSLLLPENKHASLFTGIEIYGNVIVLNEDETDAMES